MSILRCWTFYLVQELISAGPAGMEGLVKQLVTQSQAGGSSALSSRPDLPGTAHRAVWYEMQSRHEHCPFRHLCLLARSFSYSSWSSRPAPIAQSVESIAFYYFEFGAYLVLESEDPLLRFHAAAAYTLWLGTLPLTVAFQVTPHHGLGSRHFQHT